MQRERRASGVKTLASSRLELPATPCRGLCDSAAHQSSPEASQPPIAATQKGGEHHAPLGGLPSQLAATRAARTMSEAMDTSGDAAAAPVPGPWGDCITSLCVASSTSPRGGLPRGAGNQRCGVHNDTLFRVFPLCGVLLWPEQGRLGSASLLVSLPR